MSARDRNPFPYPTYRIRNRNLPKQNQGVDQSTVLKTPTTENNPAMAIGTAAAESTSQPPIPRDAIVIVNGKPAWYVVDRDAKFTVANNNSAAWVQEDGEYGAILAAEFHFDRKQDGLYIELNGRGKTKLVLMDYLVYELVDLSRGLSPGTIKHLPTVPETSPDPIGVPLRFYPYVSKFKDTTEQDQIGNIGEGYVVRYEPALFPEYMGIKVVIRNNSGSDSLILHAEVIRAVFLTKAEMEQWGYNKI